MMIQLSQTPTRINGEWWQMDFSFPPHTKKKLSWLMKVSVDVGYGFCGVRISDQIFGGKVDFIKNFFIWNRAVKRTKFHTFFIDDSQVKQTLLELFSFFLLSKLKSRSKVSFTCESSMKTWKSFVILSDFWEFIIWFFRHLHSYIHIEWPNFNHQILFKMEMFSYEWQTRPTRHLGLKNHWQRGDLQVRSPWYHSLPKLVQFS